MKLWPKSVAVVVSNRKKALRWYTQKLGLAVLAADGHWVVVGDRRRGLALHLCQTNELGSGYSRKLEPGNSGIMIYTDTDLQETYRTLKRRGVRFPAPPEKFDWGWYCMFADPDGNRFWLHPSH